MEKTINCENIAMQLIANSGDARSMAFQALQEARSGDFAKAEELMKQSEACSLLAHQVQTSLLVNEANGDKNEINVLLIHSQDHLMTSLLAQELIKEMIVLHKDKEDKKGA